MFKWQDCLFLEGEKNFRQYYSKKDNVLLFMGKGFDPRSCRILEELKKVVKNLTVFLIDYNEKATIKDDLVNESRSQSNFDHFKEMIGNSSWELVSVPMYRGEGNRKILVIWESVRTKIKKELISNYDSIIIDTSAMPRGVYFSLIKHLLSIKEYRHLSVAVCENSGCDDRIQPLIVRDSAEYLPGFDTFSMSTESDDAETIWLPVLGMNEGESFSIISEFLKPVEICPVIPFPAFDIRRGEKILRKNADYLFRALDVEKRNIIYVPEKYPVLVAQKLYETVCYYAKAFSDNRNMKYAFSSQSSKLIDIGVLLAVLALKDVGRTGNLDIKSGIVVVENQGYKLDEEYNNDAGEIYCLCLDDDEFNW